MTEATVTRAHESLEAEHRLLRDLNARVREAADLPTLVATLEELLAALAGHFAHEEQPQGLYDVIGVCSPEHRQELAALVDDHYQLLARARDLARRSRELLERPIAGVREEAQRLADALGDHERREHELARRVLGSESG